MKQVFLSGKGSIEVFDVPVPSHVKDGILVRNINSLISSGTEGNAVTKNEGLLGMYEKYQQSKDKVEQLVTMAKKNGIQQTYDLVKNKLDDFTALGYSSAGIVVETFGNTDFNVGDRVACMGAGFANHAEYVVVPKNLAVKMPDNVPFEEACFGALACIAMQGVRRLELTPGERVGIIGLGLIGQIAVRLAAIMGYETYGIDLSEKRAETAQSVSGAHCWSPLKQDSVKYVTSLTGGEMLDGVVICAATDSSMLVNQAFDMCRKLGRVSVVGSIGMELERPKMYQKELELRLSASYGPGRYDAEYEIHGNDYPLAYARWTEGRNLGYFLNLLNTGTLKISDLVSNVYPVADAKVAYRSIKEANEDSFGSVLDYGTPSEDITNGTPERIVRYTAPAVATTASSDKIRLGLIGIGGYTKGMHIPNLDKLKDRFSLQGVASKSGGSAGVFAKKRNIAIAVSDYRYLLEQSDIDAVLVTTRHSSHAQIVLDALDAGKHVFVEKPLAITNEDCLKIVEKQKQTEKIVRVGFNRRFSPWLTGMKAQIPQTAASILNIRVNVGPMGSHWSNTESEGGRLIGEGVHFVDTANWFFEDYPISVQSHFVGNRNALNPNVVLSMAYKNGSIATVTYHTLGNTSAGKEFFEISANGKTIICDDYQSVSAHGASVRGKMKKGDKGQLGVLQDFADSITGKVSHSQGADAEAGLQATRIILDAVNGTKSNS